MTTHDIPTVDMPLGRANRRPPREAVVTEASATVATATGSSVTVTQVPQANATTRPRWFAPFRFTAADIELTMGEIEADLRCGRD